uniref:Uncharacterized protein n=1 Tax=Lactuca sativa TaxID=4236 RepID=A0A9R1UUP8_LACSA|nr:hypothetical protein LSAT_V11C800451350 [Lactuca sativa]
MLRRSSHHRSSPKDGDRSDRDKQRGGKGRDKDRERERERDIGGDRDRERDRVRVKREHGCEPEKEREERDQVKEKEHERPHRSGSRSEDMGVKGTGKRVVIEREEKLKIKAEQIDAIAKSSGGDIRNTITSLQYINLKIRFQGGNYFDMDQCVADAVQKESLHFCVSNYFIQFLFHFIVITKKYRFDRPTKDNILKFILGSVLSLCPYRGIHSLLSELLERHSQDKSHKILSKTEVQILCLLLECCEVAGISMGLLMVGTTSEKAAEMLVYAHETQHEKIIRGLALQITLTVYGREEEADTLIDQMTHDQDPILRFGGMYSGTTNNKAIT